MSMSTSTEVIAHHWAFAIFLIVAIGLCCLMLVGGWFLGGRARARSKNVPFESGIDSVGSARLRLSAKFYLVAMFFVIFDVEALYLFAWSTSIRESGWVGFVEAAIFIFVLLAGLVYAGLSGLNNARFQFFNWMSGLLWVLILTTLGYLLGKTPVFLKYEDQLMSCLMLLPVVLLLFGLAGSLVVLWKKKYGNRG